MQTPWKASRVRIYVTERDRSAQRPGKPLVTALLELLRRHDAMGATATSAGLSPEPAVRGERRA
jgi:PII-like signaling protein